MKHILFVDDEPLVLRGLRRSFSELDDSWEVDCAGSGREALQKIASGPCDVLVTDMRMPGMNGAELLAEVVRIRPEIVRIVLSGQADQELLIQCANTAHHYFSKPCEPELLHKTAQRLFSIGQNVVDAGTRALINRLPLLPSVPAVYNRLVKAVADHNTDLETLARLVETDPGLTAKVLKLANSSFFGIGHAIRGVVEAIRMLGVEALKALVLSVQVADFSQHVGRAGLASERVWARAQATAAAARLIAREERLPREQQEAAFTAGILHNCGLLILAENLPDQVHAAIAHARRQHQPLHTGELQIYGATHAEVGAYVLDLWGLPASIVEAIAGHLLVPPAPTPPEPVAATTLDTLTLLHLAHRLVGERFSSIDAVPETPLDLHLLPIKRPDLDARLEIWRHLVAGMPAP
jgi:HD-like signal output (HDOD) protein